MRVIQVLMLLSLQLFFKSKVISEQKVKVKKTMLDQVIKLVNESGSPFSTDYLKHVCLLPIYYSI